MRLEELTRAKFDPAFHLTPMDIAVDDVFTGPAEPVGPVGPWPDQNFDKDSSRMRNQFDNLVTSNKPRSRPDRWSDR